MPDPNEPLEKPNPAFTSLVVGLLCSADFPKELLCSVLPPSSEVLASDRETIRSPIAVMEEDSSMRLIRPFRVYVDMASGQMEGRDTMQFERAPRHDYLYRAQEPEKFPKKELNVPKVYGPEGRFFEDGGRRFDYVFTDLLKDPTLPSECFPHPDNMDGSFYQRYVERDAERDFIG